MTIKQRQKLDSAIENEAIENDDFFQTVKDSFSVKEMEVILSETDLDMFTDGESDEELDGE